MNEDQLSLFKPEDLPEEAEMSGISLEKARQKAHKEFSAVQAEKRIPFGVAFLGTDPHFGLAILVVKFRGDCLKRMGCETSIKLHWEAIK